MSAVLAGILALVVPAASDGDTFGAEFLYFFCQPGRKRLVYFSRDSERIGANCCGEENELLAEVFVSS